MIKVEEPRFDRCQINKARVQHTCSNCGKTIKKGQHYELQQGSILEEVKPDYGYGWQEPRHKIKRLYYKSCLTCVDIRERLIALKDNQ